jgi:biotin carboxyl carrier protein
MKYHVKVRDRIWQVEIEGSRVTVDGRVESAELGPVPGTPLRELRIGGGSWFLPVESVRRGIWLVQLGGESVEVEVVDERTAHIRSLVGAGVAMTGPPLLKAPMPGLVVRVLVVPGQRVEAGASLVVLEAMKMENDLKAAGAGTVESVRVRAGQTVEKGMVLVSFRP